MIWYFSGKGMERKGLPSPFAPSHNLGMPAMATDIHVSSWEGMAVDAHAKIKTLVNGLLCAREVGDDPADPACGRLSTGDLLRLARI